MNSNTIRAIAVAITLPFTVTACGDGSSEKPDYVSASALCGGAFGPHAAKALEDITGSKKFSPYGVRDQSINDFVDEFGYWDEASPAGPETHSFCPIFTGKSSPMEVTIDFELADDGIPKNSEVDPRLFQYPIGRAAFASGKNAIIYFECISPRLDDSKDSPALIRSHMWSGIPPKSEEKKRANDNMSVMHAAALEIAKRLKCKNNGDLPAKPVLEPKS